MNKLIVIFIIFTHILYAQNNNIIKLTQKQQNFLKTHQTIILGSNSQWDPYVIVNQDGTISGYDTDILNLINKYTGANFKIKAGNWQQMQQEAKNGIIDGLSTLTQTPQRDKWLYFTKSYISIKKTILTNPKNNIQPLKSLDNLKNKSISIIKGNVLDEQLAKKLGMKIIYVNNKKETFKLVLNQKLPFTFGNSATIYQLGKMGLPLLKQVYELKKSIKLRFAIRKDEKEAFEILKLGLNKITYKEFQKIEKKWFLSNNTYKNIYTKKQSIKICTNPDWKPIEFTENGKPKGISIDILNLILKNINLKANFIKTSSWEQSQQYLKEKKCDMLVAATKTKSREKYAIFTKPYLSYNLAIVTQDNKPLVNDIKNIINKPMSRKKGSGLIEILQNRYPHLNIIQTNTTEQSFKAIQDGKAYFTISTLPILSYYKKKFNLNNLRVAGYVNIKYNLRFAIRDDDKLLCSVLDDAINLLPKENIELINQKWTSQDVIKVTDYTIVWIIVIVSLLIIFIILIAYNNQYKLKQEIQKLNNSLELRVKEEIKKNHEKEKLMLQQSRLAQMGEMISMIAHQWRQPLNTLSILIQMVIFKYEKGQLNDAVIQKLKENSSKQIKNMSDTIDDFRDFFKPQKEKVTFNIKDIITATIDIIKPALDKHHIQLILEFQDNYKIQGHKNELGQALINIINNAKDALIETKTSKKQISIKVFQDNKKKILTISDNAGGIPKDIIEKIFDPYFSTKNEKNGTGLGLYMTKMIIEEHMKNKLLVSNNQDGAIFTIIF